MAEFMKAIKAYSPKINLQRTIRMDHLVNWIAGRTGFNEGAVLNMITELRDAIAFFGKAGQGVKLNGLGTFTPSIQLEGTFSVVYRPDKWLKNEFNKPHGFQGEIINRDMIGKSTEDLVARWNEDHPDDPIEMPGKKDKKN
jgi:hypothetical protein